MMARHIARLVGNVSWRKALAPTTRGRGIAILSSVNLLTGSTAATSRAMDPPLPRFSTTRSLSSSSNMNVNVTPSYQVYGENTALTLKAIPPEFRRLGSKAVVLDAKQRGRLLFEFTARNPSDGRYAWDRPVRFALSAEEAGFLIAKLPTMEPAEFVRKTAMGPNQKVLRAFPRPDGSVQLVVDYELNGQGGQEPPTEKEAKGPLEISLMSGEYQVIKSIITYSIPRLVGWCTMVDHSIEQSFSGSNTPSPHNYNTTRDGTNVPF